AGETTAPSEANSEAEVLTEAGETTAPSEANSEAEVLTEAGETTAPSEANAPRRPGRYASAPHPDS
ncbi:MAG: hypothetical protein JOZ53_03340, partial [Planctomycetaceae bacterium]|nr:hypothetical protein [Planctomycetaceae bacterium]